MHAIGEVALWLAVVACAWTAVTAFAGADRDLRLLESGARGLHAAAALSVLAVAASLVVAYRALAGAPADVARAIAVRELWADPAARLTMWAAIGACFAALVPRVLRTSDHSARVGGQLIAAGVVIAILLAAVGGRYVLAGSGGEESGAPVVVHTWVGAGARVLVAIGAGAMLVPFALLGASARRDVAHRVTLGALGAVVAGLTLVAWVRYAIAAPAAMLDDAGRPVGQLWTTLDALWAVPPLLIATAAYRLSSRATNQAQGQPSSPRLAAIFLMVLVGVVMAGVMVPPVLDWVNARPIEVGFRILPPLVMLVAIPALLTVLALLVRHRQGADGIAMRDGAAAAGGAALLGSVAWLAGVAEMTVLFAAIVAGASAGLLVSEMLRASGVRRRAIWGAQAAAVVTAAAVLGGMSQRARVIDLAPGMPGAIDVRGAPWRLASQGTSQDEAPGWEGVVIAFEVRSPQAMQLVAAGERMYRDAHGHAATRVARPGVARGLAGDLRIVVQAISDGVARVQVQYHPLVPLAWFGAALTAVALLVAAAAPGRERTAAEVERS